MAAPFSTVLTPKANADKLAGTNRWDAFAKGTIDDISEEQYGLLQTFLERCPPDAMASMRFPSETPESFGLRLLRARKFVVDDAVKVVVDTARWRAEKDIAKLLRTPPYDILKCTEDEVHFFYPKAYFPFPDKHGRPIYVERTGRLDLEAVLMLTSLDDLIDYHIYGQETSFVQKCSEFAAATGRPVSALTSIVDLEHMSLTKGISAAVDYIKKLGVIDSAYYPETLGKLLIINAPTLFSVVWKMVSAVLDERTVSKIEILGGPSSWHPRLFDLIDPSKVPTEYGGTYRMPRGLFAASRTHKTLLSAGKSMRQAVTASAGQVVRFKWFSRPGDIRFGVYFYAGAVPAALASAVDGMDVLAGATAVTSMPTPHSAPMNVTDHPHSDRTHVVVESAAPVDGFFVAVWDNHKGWREREVYHRWDFMVNGRPECAATAANIMSAQLSSPRRGDAEGTAADGVPDATSGGGGSGGGIASDTAKPAPASSERTNGSAAPEAGAGHDNR